MQERLATEGAHVDRFYGEPDHPAGIAIGHSINRVKRRPRASLFFEAVNEWPIVHERSFLIGVSGADIEAGRRVGISGHVYDGSDLSRLVHSLLEQSP